MKNRLFLLPSLMCLWMGLQAQITSVGLIGDATPGGWDADTNMIQDPVDSNIWTLNIVLTDGHAKFRANDDWPINWGSSAFPVGTGVQDGDNIEVDSGAYNVRLNSMTGDYVFARLTDSIGSVGIIGTATPFGWDADSNMVQDTVDPDLWYMTVKLAGGEAKFRANDDWVYNWGNSGFPSGVGYQEGPNIPVLDGTYDITLNSKYGDYNFSVQSAIGIIGDATPNGWASDINMYQDPTDSNKYFITLDLVAGGLKFRQDDDWVISWGSTDFPSGIGSTDNGPNIPIPNAGEYQIMFDKSTGAYNFIENVDYANVGLIGDATANGWDSITYMNKDGSDPNLWTLNIDLSDGGAQFVGDSGSIVWGATGFPTDTAVLDGDTIPVIAGKYIVSFNSSTGIYICTEVPIYETIGIIGSATPNGWEGDDFDLQKSAADPSVWTLRMELLDGEAKFRADNAWTLSWGGGEFPSGIATTDGANIPITAGDYLIRFNSFSGAYSFTEIVEYDAISLVGKSGPFGAWPLTIDDGDASNNLFLVKDPNDLNQWTTTNVTLTAFADDTDGGITFRADTSWTVNWGAADFPNGMGTLNGANIECTAGTFNVHFNSATGEYAFSDPATSSREFLKASDIKLFPNPATEMIHVDLTAIELTGEVQFNVFDLNGKLLLSQRKPANGIVQMNIAQLQSGNYLLQILNNKIIVGKQFSIVK
ncbi:MAG: SusF/SusE family outer membrane protein [Saprospiraceae bacterium]|nr:SusF/SusE family outer membrane protein [Saprospiraceae bacterium]